MRGRGERLLGVALILAGAVLLIAACLAAGIVREDTPRATESPSYWHWLDGVAPREDTAHYITYEEYINEQDK